MLILLMSSVHQLLNNVLWYMVRWTGPLNILMLMNENAAVVNKDGLYFSNYTPTVVVVVNQRMFKFVKPSVFGF